MLRDLLKAIGITVSICLLIALVLTLGHNSRSHLGTHPRWHVAANSPPNQKSHHKPSLSHHSPSYKPTTTPKRISDASRTP